MRLSAITKSARVIASRCPGFALVELLVAMTLFAILAGLAYPSYRETVRKAKRAEGRSALIQLMQQQEHFYSRHHRYAEFSTTPTPANGSGNIRFKWFSGDSAETSAYELSAKACDKSTLEDCILLVAQPGTERVKPGYEDPECGALTLNSRGARGSNGTRGSCW